MKKFIYILIVMSSVLWMSSCSDNEFLIGSPSMDLKALNADAYYGDSLSFTIKSSDVDVPLSTLKAQLFFGEEKVAETVIRTKVSGQDYIGKIVVPYLKQIPNGKATLKCILQNINFTTSEMEKEVKLVRPDFPYLTFVASDGKEYRMDRKDLYAYGVTSSFPQKVKGYIKTPKMGQYGNELTFGWEEGAIKVGSTTSIPFSNVSPGNYEISFNSLNFEASPFIKLTLNGTDMELKDNDIYFSDINIKQGDLLTFDGVPEYAKWWIDNDFFEKQADGKLKFLPINGSYRIIANTKLKYFSVMTLANGKPAKLQDDGTGAIWIIGTGVGKPSYAENEVGWVPENALCLSQMAPKKYQITFTAGLSIKAKDINFKFFFLNQWNNGEFKSSAITSNSDIVGIGTGEGGHDDGNLYIKPDKTLEPGGVYKLALDVSKGINKAIMTLDKVGQVELPTADLKINGVKMENVDVNKYQMSLSLTTGQALNLAGFEQFNDWHINPDYFTKTSDSSISFLPLSGNYLIKADSGRKYLTAERMNGNQPSTLGDDGHGAVWIVGFGLGFPTVKDQFDWNPNSAYCMAEIAPAVYQYTAKAGPDKSTVIGQGIRADYLSFKLLGKKAWGEEYSGKNLTIADDSKNILSFPSGDNIELASGVTLETNSIYVLTVNFSKGKSNGVISLKKK